MAHDPLSPVEFVLGQGWSVEDFTAALDRVGVEWDPPAPFDLTSLDTHDGRLHGAGWTLEYSRRPAGLRLTARADPTQAVADQVASPRRGATFASDLPVGLLRDRIEPLAEMRALLPQARVRGRRRAGRVLDREAKTVVRLVLEEPSLERPGREPSRLSIRLHARPVLGYDRPFNQLVGELLSMEHIRRAKQPLVDEAVRAAGGIPGGVSSKIAVRLGPDMRADEATLVLCGRLADMVDANLTGTLADTDTEFLHDFRVAIRRTRSVLREMKGVLPAAGVRQARVDLRWIQEITGSTRDLDVHLLTWPQTLAALPATAAGDIQPLHDLLVKRRAQSFATMRRHLRSRRFADGWRAWRDLLRQPVERQVDSARPSAHEPVARVAGARIEAVYRAMVRMGNAIDDDSPPQALHDLRKRGKELRYLLELYGQLWPPAVVAPMVSTLKGLQDVLGRFQDDEVQANFLRSLAPELGAATGGIDAVIALGLVIGDLAEDEREAESCLCPTVRTVRIEEQSEPRPFHVPGTNVKVVATYNIKGGVGKTSAAVNLAALAAAGGLRTLLWDLDPQGAATFLFRVKPKVRGGGDRLVRGKSIVADLLRGTDIEGLDLLPADFSYRHMDLTLAGGKQQTGRLRRTIEPLEGDYDLAVLDCAPSISLVSENVFAAADALVVPIIPTRLSVRTFEQLMRFLSSEVAEPPQVVAFFSMVDRRKRAHREIVAAMPEQYPSILSASIPATTWVERMGDERAPVTVFAPRSLGARAYAELWQQLRSRLGL